MDYKTDIAVLIPHYNNPAGLKQTLLSICKSEIPVDVFVVDDGSVIKPQLNELRQIYSATELLFLETNKAVAGALNKGIERIISLNRYKYIARIDAGDTSIPERFRLQRDYLEANYDIVLLGGWAKCINNQNTSERILKVPCDYRKIANRMLVSNAFIHPSVMIRACIFKNICPYSDKYPFAEDFALFFEIVRKFKAANLPVVLINYLQEDNSVSQKYHHKQLFSRIRIIFANRRISFWFFYGLFRNILLLAVPIGLLTYIKKLCPNYMYRV